MREEIGPLPVSADRNFKRYPFACNDTYRHRELALYSFAAFLACFAPFTASGCVRLSRVGLGGLKTVQRLHTLPPIGKAFNGKHG